MEEGFIYIFVSNDDGQDMDVYFDDFRVTHEYGDSVAGGDHYPFGLAMDGRQVTREPYRFGYQGQFAEQDEETGWNSFEARMYDPRLGKWISPDPSRQYYSSYLGMGNNPVIGVDPDGRFSQLGAWWRSKLISNSYTYHNGVEWAVGWDTWGNDGHGAYLLGHSITEGGPGISGNYKLDFIATANATYKFGFNQVLDQGLVGFSADMGSLEAVKFNIDPQKFDGNNMSNIMEWQTPNNLTQGIRVETPYGDVKYKLNFDPSTGNFKTLEVGIGAPFIEAKVILDHNSVHTIIDAGQSFAPGQVYVALSRLTSLEGLVLFSRIKENCISTDVQASAFAATAEDEKTLIQKLKEAQQLYTHDFLLSAFAWEKLIRLGSQEDIGRSVNGHALTIDYFTGLSFHRKR